MVIQIYVVTSVWIGVLVTTWLVLALGVILTSLSASLGEHTVVWLAGYGWVVMLGGLVLALWGQILTVWEEVYHTATRHDLDGLAVYVGSIGILSGALLQPGALFYWLGIVGVIGLTSLHAGITLNRVMISKTDTLMSSLGILGVLSLLLLGLSVATLAVVGWL